MEKEMEEICQKIADIQKTTPEKVYRDMQEAIEQAYAAPQDEETRSYQAQVPRHGAVPTPEEMLSFLCAYVKGFPPKI